MGAFYIRMATNGQYYFNLKAGNNETILTSERYITKASCRSGIDSVKENATYDSRYDRKNSTNGQYYFNIKASNGLVIGTSETYTTSYGRDSGIEVVKRDAPGASVTDLA